MADVWSFAPRIRIGGYTVHREYRTDIITSRSGREQRRALRQTPRKRVQYTALFEEDCRRAFDRSMVSAQQTEVIIPERTRFVTLASGLGASATSVVISPMPDWIVQDAVLVLMAPNRQGKRTVTDVTGTTVTFSESEAESWPSGTRLHAGLTGYLDANIPTTLTARRGVVQAEITFHVSPGVETAESEGIASLELDGSEVFLTEPDKFEPISMGRVQDGAGQADYGFGRVDRFFPVDFASRIHQAKWTACDADVAEDIRQFFTRMKGQANEFWMPTFTNDLIPFAGFSSTDSEITIVGIDDADAYYASDVYKGIAVKKTDGSWICRSISSINSDSNNNTIITLNNTWDETVPLGGIEMICWMPLWRMASDILTMDWPFEKVANMTLSMKALGPLTSDSAPDVPGTGLVLSWWQNNWHKSGTGDEARLGVQFYNGSMVQLGTDEFSTWEYYRYVWTYRTLQVATVPVGTVTIRVIQERRRNQGTNNDGYTDDIQLTVDGVSQTIVNGGAELGSNSGWTITTGQLTVRTADPLPKEGSYYFYGGTAANCSAYQDVTLV